MKKFFLSAAVIVSFIGYALRGQLGKMGQDDNHVLSAPNLNISNSNVNTSNDVSAVTPQTNPAPITTPATTNTSASSSPPPPNTAVQPTPTPVVTGQYKNGTYTGAAADAYYGNIQVKVTVSGGKISDVQFLQYPNDRGHSIELNQYAMPILKSEAIQVQNANVDVVSGATDSSYAFQQSLQSALSQA